jgi:Pectate lyase superfamily protein
MRRRHYVAGALSLARVPGWAAVFAVLPFACGPAGEGVSSTREGDSAVEVQRAACPGTCADAGHADAADGGKDARDSGKEADAADSHAPDATPSSALIPSGRAIQWAPGLSSRGGIPHRTSLINVKDAPYNAKGDGATDDSGAIQAALNAATADQVVYLPASTYLINGTTLNMNTANVSLRGDGPSATVIHYTGGGAAIAATPYLTNWSPQVSVTSAATQGATQITLASAAGIAVGDLLVISQTNPSWATLTGDDGLLTWGGAPGASGGGSNDTNRGMGQVDRVTAVGGDTVTLERPLYVTFASSNAPAVNHMTPTYGIGIESLQIARSGAGGDEPNIDMETLAESWVTNVASINAKGTANYAHVFFESAYACEVRESWFQGGGVNTSGMDYGVYVVNNGSEMLVEDNVFVGMRHSLIVAAGASGNVYGYNYSTGNYESDSPSNWVAEDACSHGGESYMNLWEGNIVGQIVLDNTHGGNAYNTAYRNWSLADSTSLSGTLTDHNAVVLQNNSYDPSIVANVLGKPSDSQSATFTTIALVNSNLSPATSVTADFLQGNYDLENGTTTWLSGATALPASFYYGTPYLPAKPAWWGSLAWPAIGPDVSPPNGQIPAEVRYTANEL